MYIILISVFQVFKVLKLDGDNQEQAPGIVDDGMSAADANLLISQIKKNKEYTERAEDDNLWTIVSKAYKRNYSRVLKRTNKKVVLEAKSSVSNKEKEELEKLMNDNK